MFAKDCAEVFELVTGKQPIGQDGVPAWKSDGRQSAFKEFLDAAFKAAGIEASGAKFANDISKSLK